MSHYRVPRSTFLAIMAARQSVALDATVEPAVAKKILDGVDTLTGMVRTRSAHIGTVNSLITEMIENHALDDLPPDITDRLTDLLAAGIVLSVDNSGMNDLW